MASTSILAGLNQEVSQQELLAQTTLLLAAILDRLPRLDSNDRAIVNTSDQGNVTVALAAAQTLATVTTVTTVSTVTAVTTLGTMTNQTNIGGRDASHMAVATANMGVAHIYNNIIVGA